MDIEKAFLSLGNWKEDRDALRIFWVDYLALSHSKLRYLRFTHVYFGVISSMGHLGRAISHHLEKFYSETRAIVKNIKKSLYVNYLLTGANTTEDLIKIFRKSKEVFVKANIDLQKWKSNRKQVSKYVNS